MHLPPKSAGGIHVHVFGCPSISHQYMQFKEILWVDVLHIWPKDTT